MKEFLIIIFLLTIPLFPGNSKNGEKIFKEKCSACHRIGGGKLVGPDLKGITERRSSWWLKKFIESPSKMFLEKDSISLSLLEEFDNVKMPDLDLTDRETEDVISYIGVKSKEILEKKSEPIKEEGPGPIKEESEFNIQRFERGEKLFSGKTKFKNRGIPCISCHDLQGAFSLGGGRLGPDLTDVYENYGDEGFLMALSEIPFPTMEPIYKNKPLGKDEIEDISYFLKNLKESTNKRERNPILYAISGFIILFFLPLLIWRNRNYGVRRSLLEGGK
jgi:cytochrome c2